MTRNPHTTRLAAVKACCLGSAALSAAYYAGQAPALTMATVAGVALNPVAIALGGLAFALDLVKPQVMLAASRRGLGLGTRLAAGLIFAVLFLASMIAVDGILIKIRSDWSGERGHARDAHVRAVADHKRAAAELAGLGPTRPGAELDAMLANGAALLAPVKGDPAGIWRASKGCTVLVRALSIEACKPVAEIRAELGRAQRRAELETKIAAAKATLDGTAPPAAADPQAEALAKLIGVDPQVVSYALIALLGLALELVACFGVLVLSAEPRPAGGAVESTGHPASGNSQAILESSPASPPVSEADKVRGWVLTQLALHQGRITAQGARIADATGVSPATVSRTLSDMIATGTVTRRRAGREQVLEMA